MTALIRAARREGVLRVIGLPPQYANYAAIMRAFTKLYGIKIEASDPYGTSQQEISTVKRGGQHAPDVIDVEASLAAQNAGLFAPYEVATWPAIPVAQKAPDGAWVQDYGGYMSVGYDPTRFGTITSIRQLLSRKFAGSIALDGSPVQAPSALAGVMMANLALGGTAGNIAPGVAFFRKLAAAGNLVSVQATTPLTIKSGQTPVVINWDYLNTARVVGRTPGTWRLFIPAGAAVGSFYAQAISKKAPDPAAARLWEEFLFSQQADGGQNLWLKGGVRPVELAAMEADHSADAVAARSYPAITGPATYLSAGQYAAAVAYLTGHWAKAAG